MGKYVVAGISQLETIVKVDKIPIEYREITAGNDFIHTEMGGDAYNETLALTWLGDEVKFMSVVGKEENLEFFNPNKRMVTIETDYIEKVLNDTPTSVILYSADRQEQIFEDLKDIRNAKFDMNMAIPLIAESDMVVLGNVNFCRPLIAVAKEYKKPIAVNVHRYDEQKEEYNQEFLENATFLYFSDDTITGDPFDFVKSMADKYPAEIIILGQGKDGLIMYDRKKNANLHYNSVKTNEVVNTAGAGNALFSCFLHCYCHTLDANTAIKDAILFASYKIGYLGTSNGFMTEEQLAQWRSLIWGSATPLT
ncbi:MAG: carbohydrate kinase family protein [Lachnospiraceae bacterium]|nr:carbohydrate kinase family protein [Lachnospiraceae bacterium]